MGPAGSSVSLVASFFVTSVSCSADDTEIDHNNSIIQPIRVVLCEYEPIELECQGTSRAAQKVVAEIKLALETKASELEVKFKVLTQAAEQLRLGLSNFTEKEILITWLRSENAQLRESMQRLHGRYFIPGGEIPALTNLDIPIGPAWVSHSRFHSMNPSPTGLESGRVSHLRYVGQQLSR